jgi:hypothetical protein
MTYVNFSDFRKGTRPKMPPIYIVREKTGQRCIFHFLCNITVELTAWSNCFSKTAGFKSSDVNASKISSRIRRPEISRARVLLFGPDRP